MARRILMPLLIHRGLVRIRVRLFNAVRRPGDEPSGIEHMLRAELALRPAAPGVEFHAEEIPDFAVYAVADSAEQLTLGISDDQVGMQRNWAIHL